MDPLALSRLQFAVTTIYHFFFVPLTLGLSILVAIMQTLYYRTNDETWKKHTQFWGKLFLINFAMGVVTGIVQEFQFGMNWSEYSRFVGDVFGAPLAIEALLAFFLESTFLGLWFFGWNKLSQKVHLATIWAVAIGSHLSAFFILVANSFMQQPVGFVVRNGRAEMTDFFALITNAHVWLQYPHVLFSGLTTAAFFVLGISAYHLRKKSNVAFFQHSFQIGLFCALIASPLSVVTGHAQGVHKLFTQPMKMAATEALWQTENPASFSVLSIIDEQNQRDVVSIRLPGMLSWLYFFKAEGQVPGVKNLQEQYVKQYGPGNYVPSVTLTYFAFRLMVGAGFLMVGLAFLALFLVVTKRLARFPWFLTGLPLAIFLPYVANSTGWLVTEVGRQPWIVQGLMKTENAVSPILTGEIGLISLLLFTLLYGALMIFDIYLLAKYARHDPMEAPVGAY
ncbi:MAG: cytochrome ubiquinol oxidase subunit I [Chloroflexota bacterium]